MNTKVHTIVWSQCRPMLPGYISI